MSMTPTRILEQAFDYRLDFHFFQPFFLLLLLGLSYRSLPHSNEFAAGSDSQLVFYLFSLLSIPQRNHSKMSTPAGQLTYEQLLKKQLTSSKLLFHSVFWGAHWATFAYGWYDPRCKAS